MASSSIPATPYDQLRACVANTTEAFRDGSKTGDGCMTLYEPGKRILTTVIGSPPGVRLLARSTVKSCEVAAEMQAVSSFGLEGAAHQRTVRPGAIRLGDGSYVAFFSHGETEEEFLRDEARIIACAVTVGLLDGHGVQAIVEISKNPYVDWALDRVRSA